MAEDNLIKPEVVKPRGVPPKKLIVSIFGVIAFSAVILSYLNSKESGPVTADGIARENASKLSEIDKAAVGSGQVAVTEAANGSGLPAEFKIAATGQPASAVPMQHASTPESKLAESKSPAQGNQQVNARDQIEAAREAEILNKPMMIADHSDFNAGQGRRDPVPTDGKYGAIDQQIQNAEDAKRVHQTSGSSSQADLLAAMQYGANPRNQVTTHSGNNAAFIQEFETPAVKSSIKPSKLESRLIVMEGSTIPAVTTRDIISDIPGSITAMVNENVYDSLTAKHLLICKGSKFIGRYNSEVIQGQSRLQFAFSRLILPDGQSFSLTGFNGLDQSGASGYAGDVDNHFFRIYGTSLAIGVLADQVTRPAAVPSGIYSQPSATGQVMVETTKHILQRNQNVSPTITIRRGALINVDVRRDMVFPQSRQNSCK